jgi:hypothetical protein
MGDVVSITRAFLIMAREAARAGKDCAQIATGLSPQTLERIAAMTIDEIEELAQSMGGVSLITLRLDDAALDRLASLPPSARGAYAVSVLAGEVA